MQHSQKVVVTPYDDTQPPSLPMAIDSDVQFSSKKINKGHPLIDKFTKQLKIVLKLAKIDGYDGDFRIKDENGQYIYNSNIISLLNDATSISKVLIGYDSFISLLHKASVEPDLIVNENVKARLLQLYQFKRQEELYSKAGPSVNVKNARKRQHEDDMNDYDDDVIVEPPNKKWIYPKDTPLPDDNNDDW
jgi:hypothetical protein